MTEKTFSTHPKTTHIGGSFLTSFIISPNNMKNLINHFPVTAHLILHQTEGHLMVSGHQVTNLSNYSWISSSWQLSLRVSSWSSLHPSLNLLNFWRLCIGTASLPWTAACILHVYIAVAPNFEMKLSVCWLLHYSKENTTFTHKADMDELLTGLELSFH